MELRDLKPLFDDGEILSSLDAEHSQVKVFYERFEEDFIKNPFEVRGKKIRIYSEKSKMKTYSAYAETFVHIITRERGSQGDRVYEHKRANRVHWIKPILLSRPGKELLYFKVKDDRGLCREYYWLINKGFMVVLKEVKPDLQIVTAFCVDEGEKLNYFEKYKNYEEGISGCQK